MIKRYFFIIGLILLHFSIYAENSTTIAGRVIDEKTQEPLMFVNIGVEGTLTGTASTAAGDFTLTIPADLSDKNLFFSAIGYRSFTISISEYLNKDAEVIGLKSLSYGIEDVEITSQSMVLYRIIKDAASNIERGFVGKPFSFDALYRNELFVDQTLQKKRDALVYVSDKKGYGHRSSAYTDRNYNFRNVTRNFEVKTLADGTTMMDDLLNFDIARSGGNVLDTFFLNHYDLELLNSETVDSDSLWVIAYKLASPEPGETDVWNPSFYQGKLYISNPGRILLKAEAHIKAPAVSKHGLTVAVGDNAQQLKVEMQYVATYKSVNGKNILDEISLDKRYEDVDKQVFRNLSSLQVLSTQFSNPHKIEKRQYHENLLSDPDFYDTLKTQYSF